MEKFAVGVVLGTLCGALLVTNNYKMRTLVKKGQAEIAEKLDKLMDEKLDELEDGAEKLEDAVKEKATEVKEQFKSKKSTKK